MRSIDGGLIVALLITALASLWVWARREALRTPCVCGDSFEDRMALSVHQALDCPLRAVSHG